MLKWRFVQWNHVQQSEINFVFSCRNVDDFNSLMDMDQEILDVMCTKKFASDLNKTMNKFVQHYQFLMTLCKESKDFFSPILLPMVMFGIFYGIFITYIIITVREKYYNESIEGKLILFAFCSWESPVNLNFRKIILYGLCCWKFSCKLPESHFFKR